jgi:tetratricopeptide (TPR) repeat protein
MRLARQLAKAGLLPAAIDMCRQALAQDPARDDAWAIKGGLSSNKLALHRALQINSNLPDALNDLARLEGGQTAYDLLIRALEIDIAFTPSLTNLGLWMQDRGRAFEAVGPLLACTCLDPGNPIFWANASAAIMASGYPIDGAAAAGRACVLQPDFPAARYNLGMCQLMNGDLAEGFIGHEWRFEAGAVQRPPMTAPVWDGTPAPEKTLLILAEQGLGDSLLFARYLPLARARVGRVIFQVQPQLITLFGALEGVDRLLAVEQMPPAHDLQCQLMSLPYLMKLSTDYVPKPPRLWVDPAAETDFRQRLGQLPGLKVGLVWQGNPAFPGDPTRSIPQAKLAPLAAVEGVTWVSLQRGADHYREGIGPQMIDWMSETSDLSRTAALIRQLDLVIGVDTMIGHLTGALNKPVWNMNRFNTCWRWFQKRPDSVWYKTMRLFRQPSPGEWDPVIAAVASSLRQLVEFHKSS